MAPPPSDAEVMEMEEGQGPTSHPTRDWREPYLAYLLHEKLPADRMEACRLARCAKSYVLVDGELYKRSHARILQWCIPIEQGR